jgi:hypothetical protein
MADGVLDRARLFFMDHSFLTSGARISSGERYSMARRTRTVVARTISISAGALQETRHQDRYGLLGNRALLWFVGGDSWAWLLV